MGEAREMADEARLAKRASDLWANIAGCGGEYSDDGDDEDDENGSAGEKSEIIDAVGRKRKNHPTLTRVTCTSLGPIPTSPFLRGF